MNKQQSIAAHVKSIRADEEQHIGLAVISIRTNQNTLVIF